MIQLLVLNAMSSIFRTVSRLLVASIAFVALHPVSAQAADSIDEQMPSLMERFNVPGLSMAIIRDGQLHETRTYGFVLAGSDTPITPETMFSVGSVSKVGNAFLTLKLVSQGIFDLDKPVNSYLESWQIPLSRFDDDQAVTLRHLLSHTAGTNVHGFADFYPGEALPSTVQILEGSGPAKNQAVRLIDPVGSRFRYSGGGTTVIQMMIEDHFDAPYEVLANQELFVPLQMTRSTYENPVAASFGDIARAHNSNGNPVALPRGYEAMPEMAASGLWTTPSDLAVLLCTLFDERLLSTALVKDMISAEVNSEYGLGPRIREVDGRTAVQHGGSNNSYRAFFRLFPETRAGYIVLTNATEGDELIDELEPVLDSFVNEG